MIEGQTVGYSEWLPFESYQGAATEILLAGAPKFPQSAAFMDNGVFMKIYRLLAADGSTVTSETPGMLGGNAKAGIYGRLDCPAANSALAKGYAQHRVFFVSEQDAIQAGYRPCGRCLISEYKEWKSGPDGKESYPWKILPK